jgi:hypothetical protein
MAEGFGNPDQEDIDEIMQFIKGIKTSGKAKFRGSQDFLGNFLKTIFRDCPNNYVTIHDGHSFRTINSDNIDEQLPKVKGDVTVSMKARLNPKPKRRSSAKQSA